MLKCSQYLKSPEEVEARYSCVLCYSVQLYSQVYNLKHTTHITHLQEYLLYRPTAWDTLFPMTLPLPKNKPHSILSHLKTIYASFSLGVVMDLYIGHLCPQTEQRQKKCHQSWVYGTGLLWKGYGSLVKCIWEYCLKIAFNRDQNQNQNQNQNSFNGQVYLHI